MFIFKKLNIVQYIDQQGAYKTKYFSDSTCTNTNCKRKATNKFAMIGNKIMINNSTYNLQYKK